VGEYAAARVPEGEPVEKCFSLATREKVRKRSVY
jgi:hypothetical protein